MGAARAQEFIFRQTRLLSLCLCGSFFSKTGAPDGLLQIVGRLSHLTRLECDLQARPAQLEGILPPISLEPVTDEGVRCLSSLQSLKDLTLTMASYDCTTIAGEALHSIRSLHQLAHLWLTEWPIWDTDLSYLTNLPLMSLNLNSCRDLTSECLVHMCLITSLHSLSLDEVSWSYMDMEENICKEIEKVEELANELMPFLTTLNVQ